MIDLILFYLLALLGAGSLTFLFANYLNWRPPLTLEEGENWLLYVGLLLTAANIAVLLYYLFSSPY